MEYELTSEDFEKAFKFALNYHLDVSKSSASRTSGASRGLGGVLDSFIIGKLVEIGVAKIISNISKEKIYKPDLSIKKNKDVIDDPDIVSIEENGINRSPKCYIEIKNISQTDRWVGLSVEQFETLKKNSEESLIYIIGAYIENRNTGNQKQKDLLGIHLKSKYSKEDFKDFSDSKNIYIVIDYVVSGDNLTSDGKIYKQGEPMYDTNLFEPAGPIDTKNIIQGKYKNIPINDNVLEIYTMTNKYQMPLFLGDILVSGKIKVYEKINRSSMKRYVVSENDCLVKNDILGEFLLEKNQVYSFSIKTMGRNPLLNRNNIWIAKRAIKSMQKTNKLPSIENALKELDSKV